LTAPVVDAALKSLLVDDYVVLDVIERKVLSLTEEGEGYAKSGTPEFQYASALVTNEETLKTDVEAKVGALIAKVGFAKAMKNKWVKLAGEKKDKVIRIAAELKDDEMPLLQAIQADGDAGKHDKKIIDGLKKRKLVALTTLKSYKVTKGTNYAPQREKMETTLTADMLRTGAWKDAKFKKYNTNALGQVGQGGHLHPLLKVRTQFRQILLEMGFNEMPTQRYVENSFWNFDTLFQPQSHPARDAHDTFFLGNPESCDYIPEAYK